MDLREIYNNHMGMDCNVVEELGLSKTERVFSDSFRGDLLEVGCGNGRLGLTLLSEKSVDWVTFLDVADRCVEYVWEGISKFGLSDKNYAIARATIEKCIFTKRTNFDTITFFEGLEHVVDVRMAVDKIYSLLKKGGTFIGSVPVGMACDNPLHLHHFYKGDIEGVLSDKFSQIITKEIVINNESHYVFKAWNN